MGLALGALGMLTGQVGGHPWFKFLQQLMSSLPAGVIKTFSTNCVSLMPFHISYLNLFGSYFPGHRGPAVILWMLQEKNRFVQLCDAQLVSQRTHSLLSLPPQERSLLASSAPCLGRGHPGKVTLPSPMYSKQLSYSKRMQEPILQKVVLLQGFCVHGFLLPKAELSGFSLNAARRGRTVLYFI